MARKRTSLDVSLFPFLSVLCSVIGVLVLFIVMVLSTRVVAIEEERFQETEEYKHKPLPGKPGALEEGIDEASFKELSLEVERLSQLLGERHEKKEALTQKLAALEDLLEFKKTELLVPSKAPPKPREFDKPESMQMVPEEAFQVNLRPIFVEITNQSYTIHPSQKSFPAIASGDASAKGPAVADPELEKFLKGINHKKEYLVLLIHPNGVAPFFGLRFYLIEKHKDIRIGWEPFSRNWKLTNDR
jgi:hypothetical protein